MAAAQNLRNNLHERQNIPSPVVNRHHPVVKIVFFEEGGNFIAQLNRRRNEETELYSSVSLQDVHDLLEDFKMKNMDDDGDLCNRFFCNWFRFVFQSVDLVRVDFFDPAVLIHRQPLFDPDGPFFRLPPVPIGLCVSEKWG